MCYVHLKSEVMRKESESIIKNLPKTKSPGPDGSNDEFCQRSKKKKLIPVPLKIFQRSEEEGMLPNLFLKGQHHPHTNTRYGHYKKRIIQTNIPDEHR